MTQAELSEKLSVSAQAISKWETGGGYPDVETDSAIGKSARNDNRLFIWLCKEKKAVCFALIRTAEEVTRLSLLMMKN